MKHEKLLDAIGQVDDDLVQEAEVVKTLSLSRPSGHWKRWGALAAAAVLVIGLVWAAPRLNGVWLGGVSADTAAQETVEEAAGEDPEQEEAAEDTEGAAPAESDGAPLLLVRGADGQSVAVEGETAQTEAESAPADAVEDSGTDGIGASGAASSFGTDDASTDSTEESDSTVSEGCAEDAEGLPVVTYDQTRRTLALTLDGEALTSVAAVCVSERSGEEVALVVTDGVLTLPEGGEAWTVTVTVQQEDGTASVYAFLANPEQGE